MNTNKTIGEELSEIAPVLASLKKPENEAVSAFYFSGLKENVLAEIRKEEVIKELQVVAPALSALPKLKLQVVPANYFETLADNVFGAIQKQEKQVLHNAQPSIFDQISVWVESTLFTPRYSMALATVISAVLLSGIYFSNFSKVSNNQQLAIAVENLSREDIQEYMLEYSDEFEEIQLENEVVKTNTGGDLITTEELKAYFGEDITIEDWII